MNRGALARHTPSTRGGSAADDAANKEEFLKHSGATSHSTAVVATTLCALPCIKKAAHAGLWLLPPAIVVLIMCDTSHNVSHIDVIRLALQPQPCTSLMNYSGMMIHPPPTRSQLSLTPSAQWPAMRGTRFRLSPCLERSSLPQTPSNAH
eukprot:SAG11_NODE_1816_length_4215_cov_2.783042_5_plen_150_part_00